MTLPPPPRFARFGSLALSALLAVACTKSEASPTDAASAPSGPVPGSGSAVVAPVGKREPAEKVQVPAVAISDNAETTVHVTWDTPKGTSVNDEAPFHVHWTTSEGLAEVPPEVRAKGKDVSAGFDVRVVATKGSPEGLLAGDVDIVVCDAETHATCLPVKRKLEMPFLVGHDTTAKRETVKVTLPKAK